MFDPDFTSSQVKYNDINLSTSQSTSSSALLSSVRAERLAREEQRKQETAAACIQRVWRGRKASGDARESILAQLERDIRQDGGVRELAQGLVVLLRNGWGTDRERAGMLLTRWAELATHPINGHPAFADVIAHDPGWTVVLGLLSVRMTELVSLDPATPEAPKALASLEVIFDAQSYVSIVQESRRQAIAVLLEVVQARHWVECLVLTLEKLATLSLPKKKHPLLTPVIRLITAPMAMVAPNSTSPLIPPLLNYLLAVPSLPSVLPLPALTHLSTHLSLFTLLLPYAATQPTVLSQGKLSSELGKTHFLANLVTFGITGQMLARHGVPGVCVWMSVLGTVVRQLDQGWGRWIDGLEDDQDVEMIPQGVDSEDEDEVETAQAVVPAKKAFKPRRDPLAQNVRNKLVVLASPAHISTLSAQILSPSSSASSPTTSEDFSSFCTGLLSVFRGSPKWETVLDSLSAGEKGRALVKRIWREGVRGKWTESEDPQTWDNFSSNPSSANLVLLSHIYNHYLLLTPDDEFFSTSSNPLSTDEVVELAGIWRDLAYWSYMNGVAVSDGARFTVGGSKGSEEVRGLFTRGVTRVVERNARRPFADVDHWEMRGRIDLTGFVEAAVFEDAELTAISQEELDTATSLPRWARARQRFSKRQMAFLSPRLGLLNNLPMSVPFRTRLEVFRKFIEADQRSLNIEWHSRKRNHANIRRNHLAEDGFDELGQAGPRLKNRIEITFIDKYGMEEAGIDGGGLFKEFLTSLSQEVFDTNRGLWLATDQNELYPNPHSYATERHQLDWYRFIGQMLGKAIYEGILVDVSFADFFLAKWLSRQSYLDDLASLDKELYKGLIILKNYAKPEDLALTFAITEDEFGVRETIELVPGGAEIAVTTQNRHEYIQLVCKYKLDKQIAAQSRAFFNGLSDLIDAKWLRMFDQRELQQLIGGEETLIDMDDLRAHCAVNGFADNITPQLFWKVVRGFNQEQRRALLRFVTSCSRPPLLGFAYLTPKFGITCSGGDTDRLPSASSCFNLLKLPDYGSESVLRTKLLQAITSGAGFDMS
ncbi:hypothetical protein IAU60_001691 [Kwoniella sp. DSM 27419]